MLTRLQGTKFFYSNNGTQFYASGIWYSPTGPEGLTYIDALADIAACTRDVPYLNRLDINVLTVTGIDASNTHKACLQLFAENDIYVLIDLPSFPNYIIFSLPQWTTETFDAVTPIVDEFAAYFNTFGFYAGQGNTQSIEGTADLPFPLAAARDIKNYIQQNQYRALPVGYAAQAGPTLDSVATYINCEPGQPSVDFFAFAQYSWCGASTYTQSGYEELTTSFGSYSLPILFYEYGCNIIEPRTFEEVEAIYGADMTPWLSGGFL